MSLLNLPAPDFTLPASTGDTLTLSSYRGQHAVVLVFYPLDFSPVCSAQIPEYSGLQDEFQDLNAVVLGLSRDSVYTHKAWAAEYGIAVPLLADMTLQVAEQYGVALPEQGLCKRAVFIVDLEGKVRFEYIEEKTGDYTLKARAVLDELREFRA